MGNPGEDARLGWAFVIRWTLVNTAGLMGMAPFALLAGISYVGGSFDQNPSVGIWGVAGVFSMMAGGVLGTAQSLFLRRYILHPSRWMIATTIGVAAGALAALSISVRVSSAIAPYLDPPVGLFESVAFVGGPILGAILGTTQLLVLRGQVSRPGWWVLVSFASVPLSIAPGYAVSVPMDEPLVYGLSILMSLALFAMITGTTLAWLLRHPVISQTVPE